MQPEKVAVDMKYFKMLTDLYIPVTTKIFYIPASAEFEGEIVKNSTTDEIDTLNHLLYDMLEGELIDPDSRVYGFIDTLEASRTRGKWSVDAVHMELQWYKSMMYLCSFCLL